MKPVFFLAVAHVTSHLGKSPLQYSILANSLLFAKFIHLYNHLTSLRPLLLLLYTPTFLLVDVVTCIAFWVLVHAKGHGWFAVVLASTKAFFCLIMLGSSSTQIAFYLETGGEIKWGAASNFAHDPAGMKLLLSGGLQALMVSIVIVATASVVCQPLYNGSGRLLSTMLRAITGRNSTMTQVEQGFVVDLEDFTAMRRRSDNSALEGMVLGDLDDVEGSRETLLGTDGEDTRNPQYVPWSTRILVLAPIITTLILLAVRPRTPPYAHMSGSLPFTLLEVLSPSAQNMCLGGYNPEFIPFPLPGLISKEFWELPNGSYPGWMPVGNDSMSEDPSRKDVARPTWLPDEKLRGFDRWYEGPPDKMSEVHAYFPGKPNEPTFEGINYDPVRDPLRISNLEQSLLESLREKMGKVTIKHVVILNLESMRKDVFPLKKGSHLHDIIMKNHKPADNANDKLWDMTINAETLTGEDSGFSKLGRTDPAADLGGWRNMSEGMGGINVVGAVTGSTATFKSMLGSHCGVQPLPVDFTVEAHGHIYQPCIPSILKLFNQNKSSSLNQVKEIDQINTDELDKKDLSKTTKMTSLPWKSVFVQSITDHFDHQHELNYHMGFAQSIVKSTLRDPSSKYYPPTEEESNYFGYPERQVKPYLRDVFREAEENNQRLFLSHFTSSTHHPWALPVAAGASVDFMKRNFWGSEPHLNKYLNTVKYSDRWMGEVMDMLDEFNMADKTLVVLVGDHGMAFREDAKRHSTFENGHITNMRVPLVFHHPSLPRIQLAVNATAISILPTILDLLITTSSLNTDDTAIASDLIHQYEGQSLIRPYQVEKHGRQAWNIGVLNAGGGFLSVASAAVPFRLILPVCKSGVYRFTSTSSDPNELHPLEAYSIPELASRVRKEHSKEAAEWIVDAEKVGKWWVKEQRRRWRYHGASMQDDRKPSEMKGTGKIRKEHWWNTR